MKPNLKAAELAKSILDTKEFADLREAKLKIDKSRILKSYIDEFIKKQSEIYSTKAPPSEMRAKTTQLHQSYKQMSKIPEINEFLNTSSYFNDLMDRTYKTISEIIEHNLN